MSEAEGERAILKDIDDDGVSPDAGLDEVASMAKTNSIVDVGRSGTLYKTGAGTMGRRWKRRNFRLVVESKSLKPTLLYYDDGKRGRVRGAISLHHVNPCPDVSVSSKKDGCFKIPGSEFSISVDGRVYRMCSESAEDTRSWVEQIKSAMIAYRDAHRGGTTQNGDTERDAGSETLVPDPGTDADELEVHQTIEERLKILDDELTGMVMERRQQDEGEGEEKGSVPEPDEASAQLADAEGDAAPVAPSEPAPPVPSRDWRSPTVDDRSQMIVLLKERDEARSIASRLQLQKRDLDMRCELLKMSLLEKEAELEHLREYCDTLDGLMHSHAPV